jgi:hypothetical protein
MAMWSDGGCYDSRWIDQEDRGAEMKVLEDKVSEDWEEMN